MKENGITVSVMITFYNQAEFVDKTLSSVLDQKVNFNFEVLCGDDGSSDSTVEKLSEWEKKYPDIISYFIMDREKEKKYEAIERVSANRLNLLKNSNGKYGIFLDGDDYYNDINKLQKQVDVLEGNPDCIACGHPLKMVWDNSDKTEILGKIVNKNFKISVKSFWKYRYVSADSLMFRNVLSSEQVSLDKNFDDNIIVLYYLNEGKKIAYINEDLACYRQVDGSSWNKREECEKNFINLKDYVEETENFKRFRRVSFIRHYFNLYFVYKNRKDGFDYGKYGEVLRRNKFLSYSEKYKTSGFLFKLRYNLKYFYYKFYGIFIKVFRKINSVMIRIKRNGLKGKDYE